MPPGKRPKVEDVERQETAGERGSLDNDLSRPGLAGYGHTEIGKTME